ncbi:MAG: cyclic nucleotide-binding domain-containing protein [Solirubrobacterales bacterium]
MHQHSFSHLVRHGAPPGRAFHSEDIARISHVPLLAQLPPHLLRMVLAEASVQRHDAGDTLFRQGEEPQFLHIVMDGEIGLFGTTSDGDETVMALLKSGEVFIAAAVLTERPYLMGARALSPARVMVLPAERLRRDLHEVPDLAFAMLTSLSTHFRMLVREVKALKLQSTTQRLAHYLMSLTPRREGPTIVWLPHSKCVIAARIGIRPETLSRAFAALRRYGVSISGTRVAIDDVAVLAEFCRQDEDIA